MKVKHAVLVCAVSIAISVVLCTLGFAPTSVPLDSIATLWPGAITQAVTSVLFGGWGVIATVVNGVLVDVINVGEMYIIIGFMLPDFVQAFIPAYYYRRRIRRYGWTPHVFQFRPFLVYAILIPNIAGALIAATLLYFKTGTYFWHSFIRWSLANIPASILLGWPLLKTLGIVLVEEKLTVAGWWR